MKRYATFAICIGLVLSLSIAEMHAQQDGKDSPRVPRDSPQPVRPAGDGGNDPRRPAIDSRGTPVNAPVVTGNPDRVGRQRDLDRIDYNPQLRQRVIDLMPPGVDWRDSASRFRDNGQFIAALHASRNLDIPFRQLQDRMTGPNPMSLIDAIRDLKGYDQRDARREADKAQRQATATQR
jgi:hypothetical protein